MLVLSQLMQWTGIAPSERNERAVLLGLGLSLLAEHPEVAPRTLGWHYSLLSRSIERNQIKAYFDRFGRFCGYAWWVDVPSRFEPSLLKRGMGALEVDDLSMGGARWMVDFRASLGALPAILMDLRDALSLGSGSLTYFRYKRGRRVAKRLTRESPASFFRRVPLASAMDEMIWLRSDQGRPTMASVRSLLQGWMMSGEVLELFVRVHRYAHMPLPHVLGRIRYAFEFQQAKVLRAAEGEPQAFYSWAWREMEELARTAAKPLHTWEPGEWRDGRNACVCDAVATSNGADALRHALATFAQDASGLYVADPPYGTRRIVSSREWLTFQLPSGDVGDFTTLAARPQESPACPV